MLKLVVCLALCSVSFGLVHNFTNEFSLNLEIKNSWVHYTLLLKDEMPDYVDDIYMGVGLGAETLPWADIMVCHYKNKAFQGCKDLYGQGDSSSSIIRNVDDDSFGGSQDVSYIGGTTAATVTAPVHGETDPEDKNIFDADNNYVQVEFARKLKSGDTKGDLAIKEDVIYNLHWFYGKYSDEGTYLWKTDFRKSGKEAIPFEQAFAANFGIFATIFGVLALLFTAF